MISMATMIAVRLLGTAMFDQFNKTRLVMIVLALLLLCLIALPNVSTPSAYYLLAVVYGGSMGVALPVLNALIFSASSPAMRGLNTNMTLFAMDAGYFITPYLGGMLITLGADFGKLFYMAAGFTLVCLISIIILFQKKGEKNED
jgi:predicted MFS family arabinose efflux permease